MSKLLVLAGTSHRSSINLQLAQHAAEQTGADLDVLDLNDFEMPIYSQDREEADGLPQAAKDFLARIQAADGVVLSLAEHNGSYTAAFKNVLDWTSRVEQKLWSEKPMLLLATSPGGRGGATVLAAAEATFPHLGAKLVGTFSLPSFYDNFGEKGISDETLADSLAKVTSDLRNAL